MIKLIHTNHDSHISICAEWDSKPTLQNLHDVLQPRGHGQLAEELFRRGEIDCDILSDNRYELI